MKLRRIITMTVMVLLVLSLLTLTLADSPNQKDDPNKDLTKEQKDATKVKIKKYIKEKYKENSIKEVKIENTTATTRTNQVIIQVERNDGSIANLIMSNDDYINKFLGDEN